MQGRYPSIAMTHRQGRPPLRIQTAIALGADPATSTARLHDLGVAQVDGAHLHADQRCHIIVRLGELADSTRLGRDF